MCNSFDLGFWNSGASTRNQMNIEKRKCVIVWYFFLLFALVAHSIPISYFVQLPPHLTSKLNQRLFLHLPCGYCWFLPFFCPLSSFVVQLSSSPSLLTLLCCPDVTSGLLILVWWKWLKTSERSLSCEAMEQGLPTRNHQAVKKS